MERLLETGLPHLNRLEVRYVRICLRAIVFSTALVGGLLAVKFLILLAVGKGFRLDLSANFLFALALAQGGEFCFVLFSYHFAEKSGHGVGMKI